MKYMSNVESRTKLYCFIQMDFSLPVDIYNESWNELLNLLNTYGRAYKNNRSWASCKYLYKQLLLRILFIVAFPF